MTGLVGVGLGIVLAGCGTTEGGGDGAQDSTITVHVEREFTDSTWNEEFVPVDAAHVVIEVRRYEGEDGEAPLVSVDDVPFEELPFTHEVDIDPNEIAPTAAQPFLVDVHIFNHEGSEPAVGDLIDSFLREVDELPGELEVEVSGLESCGSPDAGGFCVGP